MPSRTPSSQMPVTGRLANRTRDSSVPMTPLTKTQPQQDLNLRSSGEPRHFQCRPPLVAHHQPHVLTQTIPDDTPSVIYIRLGDTWRTRFSCHCTVPQARELGKDEPHPMGLFATLGKFFRDLVIDVRLGVQETSKISISHESFPVAAKHGGTNDRDVQGAWAIPLHNSHSARNTSTCGWQRL